MSAGKTIAAASAGIVIWALICAAGWTMVTRGDYAKLAAVRVCYGTSAQLQSSAPECANVKPSDALSSEAAIDRKATISRLAAAFGAMAAIVLLIVKRGRRVGA